uniref:SV2 related protein b n=1 Tax=Labrus bergylta TaxID=56723 RepID=A0A3Q3FQT5_9LABR
MMILSILAPELHFIGTGLSSPIWGNVSDKYGRRVGLITCMCWTLYYGLLSAFAPVYGWLLVLRGLVGFGIGGAPQVTMYSEFLPAKARGISIMMIGAFWAIGAVFEVLLAFWIMPTLGWRWLLGLSTLPVVIFLSFSFIGRGRIKDLFSPQYWRTTLLLWFIFSNAFSYYGIVLLTTELFQAGDSCGSLECKLLTSADYKDLLWTTLAEFPDRIGRKKSMTLCFFMFSLCILPLYACIGIALTIFIFIARAFISGGYQVAFVYTPEVFPTENRALAMGTCSAMARLGALITPFVAQVMLRKSVYLTLSMYCGCCLLAGITALILPIETLGRSLQESNTETK